MMLSEAAELKKHKKKKRHIISDELIQILEDTFSRNVNWSNDLIDELSKRLQIS